MITQDKAYKTIISAYFNGRGYFTTIDQKLLGTDHVADVVAVLPIFRELQMRTQIGYAPCGVMKYMPGDEWATFEELSERSGYSVDFVGSVMKDAYERGWIALEVNDGVPRCKNLRYHKSCREMIAAFYGVENFQKKIDMLEDYKGVFNQVYFIFNYPIDDETRQLLASKGYGYIHYYEKHGAFLEMLPADVEDVDDWPRFSVLSEHVLFENMWYRKDEIV